MVLIQHIGDSAAHTRREVLAGSSQDHRAAACHVFQTVVAAALCDCHRAGIADTEALAGDAVYKGFAGRRAVESNVADDDILTRIKSAFRIRHQHKFAARKALAESVVSIARQPDRDALGHKCAKRLPASAACAHNKCVLRKASAKSLCDLRAEDRPEGPIRGRHLQGGLESARHPRGRFAPKFLHSLFEGRQEHRHIRRLLQFKIVKVLGGIEPVISALPVGL